MNVVPLYVSLVFHTEAVSVVKVSYLFEGDGQYEDVDDSRNY